MFCNNNLPEKRTSSIAKNLLALAFRGWGWEELYILAIFLIFRLHILLERKTKSSGNSESLSLNLSLSLISLSLNLLYIKARKQLKRLHYRFCPLRVGCSPFRGLGGSAKPEISFAFPLSTALESGRAHPPFKLLHAFCSKATAQTETIFRSNNLVFRLTCQGRGCIQAWIWFQVL